MMMNIKATSMKLCLCAGAILLSSPLMAQSVKPQNNIIHSKQADNSGMSNCHYTTVGFFHVLQENIVQKDKQSVAAMVKYPLWVQLNGKQIQIKDQQQFVEHYDAVITPKIEKIVQDQKIKTLLSTYRGMAFGNGEIWFSNACQDKAQKDSKMVRMQIIGINNFM
ncbi:hypothetical protein [Commensalibacter nepenthis]|uniref:Uncharacterized protein n=1 Tax=Commensalibacter nepenthis TaxID=3043872 RepID=A0ABT6Q7T1_9PROT|nr:hypothetical protein [Commensalibacter sp. TBRC 10068]MDI2112961.1 hypothetical protein [Commensalibacter sp. TBRC 10068]